MMSFLCSDAVISVKGDTTINMIIITDLISHFVKHKRQTCTLSASSRNHHKNVSTTNETAQNFACVLHHTSVCHASGPGGHFHHVSLHLCHSSLHLCHSTSTTPHSTSVTLLPAIPPPWLHPRHAPPPKYKAWCGWSYIDSVSDGSGSGSGKRGRLVSILEKCLLSGNEDKLMRVIESVVRLLFCLPVVGSLLVLLPSTSVLLPFWLNSPTASL